MATQSDVLLANEVFLNHLETPGMQKVAVDAINDFTRLKMREDGFMRRFLPPLQLSNSDLDRQVDTDLPAKIVDMEVDSPAAISVPLGQTPDGVYIYGKRYRVTMDRIFSPRFIKDVDELRTYNMDIRQVMSDNAIKDMLAEEDNKWISACNTVMVGADSTAPVSGIAQWQTILGGITRDTVEDFFKIPTRTDSHLETVKVLVNNTTIKEVEKWGRDEYGGDLSEEILRNGFADANFMKREWVVTIKRNLVPDDSLYGFPDPKFLGKNFMLEDTSMYIERKYFMLDYFAYQLGGATIANPVGISRGDFA